jgi:hypothetical protein
MNNDLKWLAESEWHPTGGAKEVLIRINKALMLPEFIDIKHNSSEGAFTYNQWQAARIELGIDNPFTPKSMQNKLKYYNNLMQNPFTSAEEDEAWAEREAHINAIARNGEPAIEYTRTAEQFLSQAADLLIERGKQYDKPSGERSMGSTVKAFNAITNKTLSESEGWLFMSILKRVRQFQGPYHKDSAEDAVSYSALEAEALERGL